MKRLPISKLVNAPKPKQPPPLPMDPPHPENRGRDFLVGAVSLFCGMMIILVLIALAARFT